MENEEKVIFRSQKPIPIEISYEIPEGMEPERCEWGCWIGVDGKMQCGFRCDM
ncbi:hypothetical protein [Bacillus subtilis]|uniref:hypothetical protein n=1 Tax=Bacillus subtilis TaxID=1423 RepID=UPI0013F17697|nr:hypothetical protein [Bacillus subtilis]